MIATRTVWRYLKDGSLETTEAGERCDWVTPNHVYVTLGWVVPA